jgi:hypothetical protein
MSVSGEFISEGQIAPSPIATVEEVVTERNVLLLYRLTKNDHYDVLLSE